MSDLPNGDSIDLSSLVSKLNELRDFTTFITTAVLYLVGQNRQKKITA